MHNYFKNKIFRTRQLVKKSLEDLQEVRQGIRRLEESLAPSEDGLPAWSASVQESALRVLSLLKPHSLKGLEKVRLGAEGDGGYVVPADWHRVSRLVSLGIGPENTFDLAFAKAGISVEAFDHTIHALPEEHPKIVWRKKKISFGEKNQTASCNLNDVLPAAGVPGEVALKTDIEGWEYPVLLDCPEEKLRCLRFLVGEFHDFGSLLGTNRAHTLEATFAKLHKHFAVIHLHGNNADHVRVLGGMLVPNLMEITWVNRSLYSLEPFSGAFPTALDRPNDPQRCEIWLGGFDYSPKLRLP